MTHLTFSLKYFQNVKFSFYPNGKKAQIETPKGMKNF